jgi:hypothetical protein
MDVHSLLLGAITIGIVLIIAACLTASLNILNQDEWEN